VEEMLSIVPVGLIPLDVQEGFFFLSVPTNKSIRIYQYRLSIFTRHDEKYRSMKTEFIEARQRSIVHTYESIKTDLIRSKKDLPNPAVYSIESELSLPVDETLLPIAKRTLVRYISSSAA
jgi:hypothetical protein